MPMISAAMSWSRMAMKARPDARAHEVHGRDDGDGCERHEEIIKLDLGIQFFAEEGRARHLDGRLHAAGDRRRVVDDPLDDELRGPVWRWRDRGP